MNWNMTIAEAIKLRKVRTWASAVVIAVSVGLFFVGCGAESAPPNDEGDVIVDLTSKVVSLPDGGEVTCVVVQGNRYDVSLSCNWPTVSTVTP